MLKVSRETVGEMDWLTFAVQDTGVGISPKILKNLFKGSADDTLSLSGLVATAGHHSPIGSGDGWKPEWRKRVGGRFHFHLALACQHEIPS